MKRIILVVCLINLTQFTGVFASDSIPNPGFESWIFGGWGANPRFWGTNNSQFLPATVIMDNNSYSGTVAMMLINEGSPLSRNACAFGGSSPIKRSRDTRPPS